MKKALITGGAKRLGKEIALWLAQYNYDICITYNTSNTNIEIFSKKIKKINRKFFAIEADFSKKGSIEYVFQEYKKFGDSIDLLINNAAVFPETPIKEITEAEWERTFDINLKSVFFLSQKFYEIMNRDGLIINITSIGAFEIWKNRLLYNLTKSSVELLTKILAKEYAPKIRVNSIAPGAIKIGKNDKTIEQYISADKIPLKRYGTNKEIISAVKFLIENKYITGTSLIIDGGKSIK